MSYRLNCPTGDEATMLLTVSDFEDLTKRTVPEREGQPIVALDLGKNRAWSAALALYRNGRVEARAVAPGIPALGEQEERDRVPRGTYSRLADQGVLIQAEGLRVPPPKTLIKVVTSTWGQPASLICDRFRLDELQDAGVPCRVIPRVSRWSEASYDIRALRTRTKDGPFAIARCSRSLLAASLAVAKVKNDDGGSTRLIKRDTNNTARDDVAAAFILAAGLLRADGISTASHHFEDTVLTRAEQQQFYQGSRWRRTARAAKARDGFLCVACRREGRTVAAEVVHHRQAINDGGEKLDLENLESCCREHHEQIHGRAPDKQQLEWTRYLRKTARDDLGKRFREK